MTYIRFPPLRCPLSVVCKLWLSKRAIWKQKRGHTKMGTPDKLRQTERGSRSASAVTCHVKASPLCVVMKQHFISAVLLQDPGRFRCRELSEVGGPLLRGLVLCATLGSEAEPADAAARRWECGVQRPRVDTCRHSQPRRMQPSPAIQQRPGHWSRPFKVTCRFS